MSNAVQDKHEEFFLYYFFKSHVLSICDSLVS